MAEVEIKEIVEGNVLIIDYLGGERRMKISQKAKNYHKLHQLPQPGSRLRVTRILKEGYNGKVMEFFRLDKVITNV